MSPYASYKIYIIISHTYSFLGSIFMSIYNYPLFVFFYVKIKYFLLLLYMEKSSQVIV